MPRAAENPDDSRSPLHSKGMFPVTVWTVVLAVREPETRTKALETLCRRYWRPVYVWVRRTGRSQEDAEDLTQAFFLKVLSRSTIERVQRERGRFRSYLLMVLQSFLRDEWDRSRAQRRGGGRVAFSLDVESEETAEALATPAGCSPERAFDRRWALEVLEQARQQLGAECAAAGKDGIFRALFPGPGDPEETQPAIAEKLGLTPNAVKLTARRMRRRLEALIRAEVAQTVSSHEELEEEIRYLMAALTD